MQHNSPKYIQYESVLVVIFRLRSDGVKVSNLSYILLV